MCGSIYTASNKRVYTVAYALLSSSTFLIRDKTANFTVSSRSSVRRRNEADFYGFLSPLINVAFNCFSEPCLLAYSLSMFITFYFVFL